MRKKDPEGELDIEDFSKCYMANKQGKNCLGPPT